MYQKEIIYLGMYKDGNRLGSAGFLKVEKKGKEGSLSLVVKNAPPSVNGRFLVRYYSGTEWKEADGITVREGGGNWEKQETDSLEQVRLQIMLPGGYLVEGASKTADSRPPMEKPVDDEPMAATSEKEEDKKGPEAVTVMVRKKPVEEMAAETTPEAVITDQPAEQAADLQKPISAEPSVELVSLAQEKVKQERYGREKTERERSGRIERIPIQRQFSKPLAADAFTMENLKEDKWEQILDTYDQIHPYGDDRVYVKLEPKDFIILSSKYQHLVNNSFLLHGFYNYRHIILGKEGDYYLGVPGVFYEREKMVALMFGFEAFECGSREPESGEFGYYLRKVEL